MKIAAGFMVVIVHDSPHCSLTGQQR